MLWICVRKKDEFGKGVGSRPTARPSLTDGRRGQALVAEAKGQGWPCFSAVFSSVRLNMAADSEWLLKDISASGILAQLLRGLRMRMRVSLDRVRCIDIRACPLMTLSTRQLKMVVDKNRTGEVGNLEGYRTPGTGAP